LIDKPGAGPCPKAGFDSSMLLFVLEATSRTGVATGAVTGVGVVELGAGVVEILGASAGAGTGAGKTTFRMPNSAAILSPL
jgi:hypothetical protein